MDIVDGRVLFVGGPVKKQMGVAFLVRGLDWVAAVIWSCFFVFLVGRVRRVGAVKM